MVLVLLVAALALAAALLSSGGRLAGLRIRAVRLLVAAAVVQVSTSVLAPASATARAAALVVTAVLVVLFVIGNRRLAGTPLVAAGLMCNAAVIAANGAMPVSLAAAERAGLARADLRLGADLLREPMTGGTRLRLLGDVVPVALPARPQVVSPGDVLVAAGVGLLLLAAGAVQTPRRTVRSTMRDRASTTSGSYS